MWNDVEPCLVFVVGGESGITAIGMMGTQHMVSRARL